MAANTLQAYASDLRHFTGWGGRIPATSQMVARYVADCAGSLKASTLSRRLAAINSAHAAISKESPVRSEVVRRTMRGIRRVHGVAARQARPISIDVLRSLARPQRELPPMRDLRDRALLLLCFAGGFRRSEIVNLVPTDLHFTREGMTVHVRRSKTGQQARGRTVAIPCARGALCPVKLMVRWLAALKLRFPGAWGEALFRRIDRYGNLGQGLQAASVGGILRERLRQCGHDPSGYSSHSLRAGLVSAAAVAGSPTWVIQRQTGHRSERTVHRYIRDVAPFKCNAFGAVMP